LHASPWTVGRVRQDSGGMSRAGGPTTGDRRRTAGSIHLASPRQTGTRGRPLRSPQSDPPDAPAVNASRIPNPPTVPDGRCPFALGHRGPDRRADQLDRWQPPLSGPSLGASRPVPPRANSGHSGGGHNRMADGASQRSGADRRRVFKGMVCRGPQPGSRLNLPCGRCCSARWRRSRIRPVRPRALGLQSASSPPSGPDGQEGASG
jgi:hypothetical protein